MEEPMDASEPIVIAYEWGRTAKGDPISRPHNVLVTITTEALDASEIVDVEECGEALVVLTSKGSIYTCGSNKHGVLGIQDLNVKDFSEELKEVRFEKTSISDIGVGSKHVLALTREGRVYAWGNNNYGQIGKPNEPKGKEQDTSMVQNADDQFAPVAETKSKIVTTPTLISFDRPISEVLAIEYSSYALDEQGQVWSWGREQYIGRATGEVMEENNDGVMVKMPANHIPRKVKVVDQSGKNVKVRHIMRKGRKVLALLEGGIDTKSNASIMSSQMLEEKKDEVGELSKASMIKASKISYTGESIIKDKASRDMLMKKARESEHEQAEYNIIKELIADCNSRVVEPMMRFQKELQTIVDEYKNFIENPFGDVLNDDNTKDLDPLSALKKRPLHIDIKKGMNDIEIIVKEFEEIKKKYPINVNEVEGNRLAEITQFLLRNLEDSIRLRKLGLLAFKLHGYHLRLKHKNVLSLASSNLLNEWANVSELTKKMKDIFGECEYITKRFSALQGEFNKAYDDKIDTIASRTAYHIIDTTYSECQAWKYVNIIGEYAIIYRTGYENFISISEKMERLYGMYTELKKGDVYQIAQSYKAAVASETQKTIIEKGRNHIIATNDQIILAKSEVCVDGIDGEVLHKKILAQAYEILVDSAILRIAYYDLFLSYYDQLVKTQGSKEIKLPYPETKT